jgi:membrane protein DedA with SNARE-associated domain
MIEKIIAALANFIIAIISGAGYFGVLFLMAIESACIPLPSEIIMPFAGYLAYKGQFSLYWAATAGALGCNLGSLIAYEIGHYGGRPLVERYGSYILINRHDLELADRFFLKFGSAAVFIARLLPVVRTFIALPAGVARMPRIRFHIYTFAGSWPWCFMLAWIGMKLGEHWESDPRLKLWLHRLDLVIIALILAAIVWFVRSHWKNRMRVPAST